MTSKGLIISGIIVLIVGGAIFYSYSQTNDSNQLNQPPVITGPSIEVSPTSYDLGTVIYGDVPERIFQVKNIGTEPLEILKLSTSCGCTSAFIDEADQIIAPGQVVDMKVTFDPAVHKDATDLGELTRVVYIKTNDSTNPEVEVEIYANVIKE